MTSRPSVALVTLGCRVNRSEGEELIRALAARGADVVSPDDASVVIVNSCCVTAEAEAKSRKAARRWARRAGVERVVVWGCAARLFASEFTGISEKVRTASSLEDALALIAETGEGTALEPVSCASVCRGLRARSNVKIQDGCDRRCAYCIVWKARGPSRSMPVSEVRRRVSEIAASGVSEVVLCGINLGAWHDGSLDLPALVETLLEHTPIRRIRLSSIEPEDASDELFRVMAAARGRVAEYLALPLQSGCDETLRAMGRRISAESYRERVLAARERMPHVAVVADFMCGFPGEGDEEFERSLAFAEELALAKLHVFRFSPRPGTVAAKLGARVPERIVKERSERALELSVSLQRAYAGSLIGTEQRIVVEERGRGLTGGHVRAVVDDAHARQSVLIATPRSLLADESLDCREGAISAYDGGDASAAPSEEHGI